MSRGRDDWEPAQPADAATSVQPSASSGDARGADPSPDLGRDSSIDARGSGLARPHLERGSADRIAVLVRDLDLPTSDTRARVAIGDRAYALRGAESRILATVAVFRSVAEHDLDPGRLQGQTLATDLGHLADVGLITRSSVVINGEPSRVVTLTDAGRALLDARQPSGDRQALYGGLVKPRELAHDAQLYRLFQTEASRIEADGGRVTRVVLDHEIKREYQRFLHGRREQATPTELAAESGPSQSTDDRNARVHEFAEHFDLPLRDGHLEIPDLRIEFEDADGRPGHRDVELVTRSYSRSQLAAKSASGFATYRAVGRGGGSSASGEPYDPHRLERVL